MKKEKSYAIGALLMVALGFSILSIAARLMSGSVQPMTQVWMRVMLGALVSLILFRKRIRLSVVKGLTVKDWLLLLFYGVFGYAVGVYFVTMGALSTSLLSVSVVFSTISIFVYIYCIIFLKEKFKPVVVILILLSLVGISFLISGSFTPEFGLLGRGELYVLISAALMGTFPIVRRKLSSTVNDFEVTSISMVIAALSMLILSILGGEHFELTALVSVEFIIGLLIGAGLNILSTLLESFAFTRIEAVLGNQILLAESLFSAIIGMVFYDESLTLPAVIGGAIVIASIYVLNRITG